MAGLASGYNEAYFDNFRIDRIDDSPVPISYTKKINFNNYDLANSFEKLKVAGTTLKLGMKINIKQNINITDLGRLWINRSKRPHTVSIYDADTLELKGSALISMDNHDNPGEPNFASTKMDYFYGFVYKPVNIQLDAGEYYIVSDEMIGGDKWYGGDSYLPVISPVDGDMFGDSVGVKCIGDPKASSSWTVEIEKPGNCYGPVNFKFLLQ
jgi:hypothetical protein